MVKPRSRALAQEARARTCLTSALSQPELQASASAYRNHAMPSDYTTAGGGLKLKGAGGVDKKKKKKRPKPTEGDSTASTTEVEKRTAKPEDAKLPGVTSPGRSLSPETAERAIKEGGGRKKTEAEKRHEEYRRKRLEEKMRKEGVKTHKEKVEELNKYLSGLSEHHDMPKIGPG
jgi:protein FAM32A